MRRQAEMSFGPLEEGGALEALVWPLIEGAAERSSAGRATWLWVTLADDGWVEIQDDGPGLAITSEAASEKAALLRMCTRHTSMFWELRTVHTYNLLRGGTSDLARVNGFSADFELETRTRRGSYLLRCKQGVPLEPVQEVESTLAAGTRIRFRPDPAIFGAMQLDAAKIHRRLRELAYLCPALTINFNDERFRQRSGVRGWVEERVTGPVFSVVDRSGDLLMDLALGFALDGETTGGQLRSFSFWKEKTGAHVDGLFLGIGSALTGEPCPPKPSAKQIAAVRLRLERHVVAMLHVFPEKWLWESDQEQVDREVFAAVARFVGYTLADWLKQVPEHAERIRAIVLGAT